MAFGFAGSPPVEEARSLDHHAAFFAAASVAYAAVVAVSIVHVASVAAVTGAAVVASVGTSWDLVAASSGDFPFEKQDVASAFAAAVASVVAVVVASVAVVAPFAVASVVASSVWVVPAASFLVAAVVVVVVVVASLGSLVGAAPAALALGIGEGSEFHPEAGSLASRLDLAFSASAAPSDSLQLWRNLVGLERLLLTRFQALVVSATWPQ